MSSGVPGGHEGFHAQGRSNKDIGTRLAIGETTVKSHLRSIFSKLQVLSRTEANSLHESRGDSLLPDGNRMGAISLPPTA